MKGNPEDFAIVRSHWGGRQRDAQHHKAALLRVRELAAGLRQPSSKTRSAKSFERGRQVLFEQKLQQQAFKGQKATSAVYWQADPFPIPSPALPSAPQLGQQKRELPGWLCPSQSSSPKPQGKTLFFLRLCPRLPAGLCSQKSGCWWLQLAPCGAGWLIAAGYN